MKYFITTTHNAESITRKEAISRGCGPVTTYWWGFTTKWDDPEQAALVFDDTETVPEECQPTQDFLPPDWFEPGTAERAAAEEMQRNS